MVVIVAMLIPVIVGSSMIVGVPARVVVLMPMIVAIVPVVPMIVSTDTVMTVRRRTRLAANGCPGRSGFRKAACACRGRYVARLVVWRAIALRMRGARQKIGQHETFLQK